MPARTASLSPERLTRLVRATDAAPSPCGSWLAVACSRLDEKRGAYVSDLWRVSLLDPAEPPVRLTRGPANDRAPRFRADGALGFTSDRTPDGGPPGDDARSQVWLLDPRGGEPVPMTDEPLGVLDFRLAGDRVFVAAPVVPGVPFADQRERARERKQRGPSGLRYRAMPVRHWDRWLPRATPHIVVWEHAASGARRDLTPDAIGVHRVDDAGLSWDVSACGRWVAVSALRTGPHRLEDSALRVIDANSGNARDLGVVSGTTHESPRFSPDARQLACVRGDRSPGRADQLSLRVFDLGGDDTEGRPLAADWDRWPELHGWTTDGGLLVTAHDRGFVPVFRVDAGSGRLTRLTAEAAGGSHGAVAVVDGDDGPQLVGLRDRFVHPPQPFRAPLAPDATPELLAPVSEFGADVGEAIADWASLASTGKDGAEVQWFLLRPRGNGPHPALVWIHGGPASHSADRWHWRWNPLVAVSHGYAVALPNPRGSTGFGQAFIQGVWDNTWGAACYHDLMAVTDDLVARTDIDGEHVGAMGGSFGGYMANWIGGNTSRFACLLSHAGIYSMPAFHGTTDYPAYFAMMTADPDRDRDAYDLYSPHRRLSDWTTPTLITHGAKDYRVPVGESLALFEGLTRRGVDVELLVFPDENHWIRRPANARQWYRALLEFADRHLRGKPGTDTSQDWAGRYTPGHV